MRPGLSILCTFHDEGPLARMTGNSLARCMHDLDGAGVEAEVVCVLDNAKPFTIEVVHQMARDMGDRWRVLLSDEGDLGPARNRGIAEARFDHVCVADGDDYYSANWPLEGYRQVRGHGGQAATHPEFVVNFGAKEDFTQQFPQSDPLYDRDGFLTVNFWGSTVLAATRTFLDRPYGRNRGTGFGFEDWHWNCELVAAGGVHLVAPGTAIFYRRKNDGLLARETQAGLMIQPTSLFSGGSR